MFNKAIAEVLCGASPTARRVGLEVIRCLLQMSQSLSEGSSTSSESNEASKSPACESVSGTDPLFESLISSLCRASLSSPWTSRQELYDGIFLIMDGLGRQWSARFEVEVMHVAILGLKTAPRDIPSAAIKAFQFFSQMCARLYGSPRISKRAEKDVIQDPLAVAASVEQEIEEGKSVRRGSLPSDAVMRMIIADLASVKQIVRYVKSCICLGCHCHRFSFSSSCSQKVRGSLCDEAVYH